MTKFHSAVPKAFVDNGITTMFGVAGNANLYMADSFRREHGGTYIASANEAGAVLMALGYASISGKLGLATVSQGPGLANTVTALIEGVKGQTPMVLLCGDSPVEEGETPQNIRQRELVSATGAGFEQVRSARTFAEDVAIAIRRAWVERRPVVLNVPIEFQWMDVKYEPVIARIPESRGLLPAGSALDEAAGIIATAKRPIILAGRGALHGQAKAAILQLAERIESPLATTLKARTLFAGEKCDLGIFGTLSSAPAVDAIMQSDCIIAFGASLSRRTMSNGTFEAGKRIVQINAEAGEIGKYGAPDVGLVGDLAATAQKLLQLVQEADLPPSGFRSDELHQRLARHVYADEYKDTSRPGAVDIRTALSRIGQAMPQDRIVATDGGRFLGCAYRAVEVPNPQSFLFGMNFSAIGLGVGHAVGACVADRSRPVLLITGDGGFMLGGLNDFYTAVRNKCDLVVAMCNDGSYGAEHAHYRKKDMDPSLSLFDWPEFADVAIALGGAGITVRSLDDLDAAVRAIAQRDRPLLIDIKLDPECVPGSH